MELNLKLCVISYPLGHVTHKGQWKWKWKWKRQRWHPLVELERLSLSVRQSRSYNANITEHIIMEVHPHFTYFPFKFKFTSVWRLSNSHPFSPSKWCDTHPISIIYLLYLVLAHIARGHSAKNCARILCSKCVF